MKDIPELALSVRQPWAWAIIHAGKDIENRSWLRQNPGLRFRGRVAIHASSGLARWEYEDAVDSMARITGTCPRKRDVRLGEIIGSVDIVDVVKESESPWFFGPQGLVLANPMKCDPIRAKGALGFFKWQGTDTTVSRPKWLDHISD